MKLGVKILMVMVAMMLLACAPQEVKQDLELVSTGDELSPLAKSDQTNKRPPKSTVKNGKVLDLVRVMDGGICKNEYQGVKGEFLVYAYAKDIERIKTQKGPQIFAEFEVQIQDLSTAVLEQAVEEVNLAEDPFALGADEMQQKLTKQLRHSFRRYALAPINKFIAETSLTIDVIPFAPSLVFFQHGCEATEVEPEQ